MHVSNKLRKEIRKRSQLKSSRCKNIDLFKFRKQTNLVVNLYKKDKKKFVSSLLIKNEINLF